MTKVAGLPAAIPTIRGDLAGHDWVRAFRIFSGVNRLGASRRALSAVAASEKSPMAGAFLTLAKSRFNSRLSARRRLREPLDRGRVG